MSGFNNTIGFVERKYSKTEHDSIVGFITNAYGDTIDYVNRVNTAGGETLEPDDLFQVYNHLETNGQMDNLKLLYLSNTGMIQRVDGVLKFVRTAYDASENDNDLDGSATASLQPRLIGGIAPNSKVAASNQNGEGRYFTHPEISFADGDEYSIHFLFEDFGRRGVTERWLGGAVSGEIQILSDNRAVAWVIGSYGGLGNLGYGFAGKRTLYSFTVNSEKLVTLYINGVLFSSVTVTATNGNLSRLLRASVANNAMGNAYVYHIQSSALTPAQVLAEYNLLRSLYPEIESVQIGTQTWATRNFEAVATPLGNVIANVTENGAVEKVINGGFDTDSGFNKYIGATISGGYCDLPNTAYVVSTPIQANMFVSGKWYKYTVNAKVNSGTGNLRIQYGSGANSKYITLTTSYATYSGYYKPTETTTVLTLEASSAIGGVSIDSVSIQELNWANATEIYDAVYAATSGTAAEKEYAALKEASMWCYHNNDPDNGAIHGKLYNWYAAKLLDLDMVTAGFGWRVPTSTQWTALATELGGASVAGGKMKMTGTDYWVAPNTGATNESGFTVLPSGRRSDSDGSFSVINLNGEIWTSALGQQYRLSNLSESLTAVTISPVRGLSIRLIKE